MGRFAWILVLAWLSSCQSTSHEDSLYYAPEQIHLQVSDSARVFFSQAQNTDEYREAEFLAEVQVESSLGSFRFEKSVVNLHGASTLEFPRKSFEVKLPWRADPWGSGIPLKKLFLIAMENDTGYFRNHLSYQLMRDHLGLFLSEFRYIRLTLNGQDQGLYLMVERFQDALERFYPEAVVVRRGFSNLWDPKGALKDNESQKEEALAELKSFYDWIEQYEGQELYDRLKQHVDMDMYFRWLALNRLLRNGDYTDEVFFYKKHWADSVWSVAGWDYDDIFSMPHDNLYIEGNWVFCVEYPFDRAIATTPEMYADYLKVLQDVAQQISPERLDVVFQTIRTELLPWFNDTSLARINDNFHSNPEQAPEVLELELQRGYQQILATRDSIADLE